MLEVSFFMGVIKELPSNEKPREKALQFGIRTLSNRELLSIVIRHGAKGLSALEVADCIIEKAGGIAGIERMDISSLQTIPGIQKVKALELKACFELSRRAAYENVKNVNILDSPEKVASWLIKEIGGLLQENFLVIYLDINNHMIGYKIHFVGTLNAASVYPREVIKEALLLSSTKILLVHNHPSGNLEPSVADIKITEKICNSAELLDIQVLDHIIVSQRDYFSFSRNGLMDRISVL